MFSLHYSYKFFDRYSEFLLEKRINTIWIYSLNFLGYGCFFYYIYLLVFQDNLNPIYLLLDLYSLYTRLSVLIVFKIFQVPNILLHLLEKNSIANDAKKTIEKHRAEILDSFFKNIYGYSYDRNLIYLSMTEIKEIVFSFQQNRINWKKIGKVYLGIHIILTLTFFIFISNID